MIENFHLELIGKFSDIFIPTFYTAPPDPSFPLLALIHQHWARSVEYIL